MGFYWSYMLLLKLPCSYVLLLCVVGRCMNVVCI